MSSLSSNFSRTNHLAGLAPASTPEVPKKKGSYWSCEVRREESSCKKLFALFAGIFGIPALTYELVGRGTLVPPLAMIGLCKPALSLAEYGPPNATFDALQICSSLSADEHLKAFKESHKRTVSTHMSLFTGAGVTSSDPNLPARMLDLTIERFAQDPTVGRKTCDKIYEHTIFSDNPAGLKIDFTNLGALGTTMKAALECKHSSIEVRTDFVEMAGTDPLKWEEAANLSTLEERKAFIKENKYWTATSTDYEKFVEALISEGKDDKEVLQVIEGCRLGEYEKIKLHQLRLKELTLAGKAQEAFIFVKYRISENHRLQCYETIFKALVSVGKEEEAREFLDKNQLDKVSKYVLPRKLNKFIAERDQNAVQANRDTDQFSESEEFSVD